jgi:GT2 family glycosyltransferase
VTYGTFTPDSDGVCFPASDVLARDFAGVVEVGANTIRTYTAPSIAVLDEASRHGLRVFAGVPWPQHVAFLDSRATRTDIRRAVARQVRQLASHPATLLIALGNEISPSVVRWYGRRRIETFLRDLFDEAKAAAPNALLTYVNYPPTEYLETPFFDVCAFNVFLHEEADLRAYLRRLHNIAGPRPLLVAELGADSLRNGETGQAELVSMQLRAAFEEHACGAIAFSWTDEWWRGGRPVGDWAFGLVDASRRPKRAYHAVSGVFGSARFSEDQQKESPRVSVVVCAYNAAATIDECLASLEALTYPDFEIICINDGSTDGTRAIAAHHPRVHIIDIENSGLSTARNLGLEHARGDIVAYIDADARVDRDWLNCFVQQFVTSDVVAVGGPNVVPRDDPWFAQAVARAPGGPTHVLLDDRIAEHVPGCNCAFRREALVAIGGFNPIFVRAGDDVDVCWRLQEHGLNIGFAPAALVWHHHRASVRAYLRQQAGYGEGETWLMREHPDKFVNGRAAWQGHISSSLPFIRSISATRINSGPFGSAGFPSVYRTDGHPFAYLPHTGRCQVAWMLLLALAAAVAPARPTYGLALLAAGSILMVATVVKCLVYGWRSDLSSLSAIGRLPQALSRVVYRLTIAALHFLQPFARLYGRVRGVINRPSTRSEATRTRPRRSVRDVMFELARGSRLRLGRSGEQSLWTDNWIDVGTLLLTTADRLRRQRGIKRVEADTGWWEDRDMSIATRRWFLLDVRTLVEDHGHAGCVYRLRTQLRVRSAVIWPIFGVLAVVLLQHAGGIGWLTASVVAGVPAAALAIAQVGSASRTVADALHDVATGFGMVPMVSGDKRADRMLPPVPPASDAPRLSAGSSLRAGKRSLSPPAVALTLSPDLKMAAARNARRPAVPRALAGKL